MTIPAETKTKYVKTGANFVTEYLQITVGKNFELNPGDSIIVHPKKSGKLEIKRKEIKVPKDFNPWYASA